MTSWHEKESESSLIHTVNGNGLSSTEITERTKQKPGLEDIHLPYEKTQQRIRDQEGEREP